MSDNNKKIDAKKEFTKTRFIKDYEDVLNNDKLHLFPSVDYNTQLRNLTNPKFLGSYHMKEDINPKYKTLNTLLRGDLEAKYSKALRSTIVNPITIALILIGLIFNILLFFFI
ncbi:MAG: hypothetical protein EAX91_11375 [Candidatus Lokiarchaeota archaeon]|nr:hypothetical protein [Candidatus Lokiarchaeota archaeon]